MFILPYFYRVISGAIPSTLLTSEATINTITPTQSAGTTAVKEEPSRVIQFSILTLSGTTLWKEEDTLDILREVLEPNGLFLSGDPILHNGIYYCPVDLTRTDTSDDYHWEEIDPTQGGQFCWRTFYQCHPYHLSPPASERLEPFSCREILDHLMTLTTR